LAGSGFYIARQLIRLGRGRLARQYVMAARSVPVEGASPRRARLMLLASYLPGALGGALLEAFGQ
jgi:hypothetical protein